MALTKRFIRVLNINSKTVVRPCSKNYSKSAGIIVIGDEILNGDVADTNSNYITKSLYNLGVQTQKISVISDNIDEISNEVVLFSKKYDIVITSGGIGPTHDDVTFEGVAKAFNEELIFHPTLVKICSEYFNTDDLTNPVMKLAKVPSSAKLTFANDKNDRRSKYPNVAVKNVYIFPGIPQLLQYAFDNLAPVMFSTGRQFYTENVYFNVTENKIAQFLDEVLKSYPDVRVGSYPVIQNTAYKVRIKIESNEEKLTAKAAEKLIELVPKEYICYPGKH